MRLFVDTTPLRVSRDFRRLWIGQAVSFLGTTITMAALPFQVFHETGSSLAVGLLGVAQSAARSRIASTNAASCSASPPLHSGARPPSPSTRRCRIRSSG